MPRTRAAASRNEAQRQKVQMQHQPQPQPQPQPPSSTAHQFPSISSQENFRWAAIIIIIGILLLIIIMRIIMNTLAYVPQVRREPPMVPYLNVQDWSFSFRPLDEAVTARQSGHEGKN
ncbi:hypothetical protein AC578_9896 [Pseudocercospora eumusae]|uniref:Uncharacterized protein n=1 Tax=Pseudocercospora eumusae TaxID=321146 RepID=A0A139HAY7_9PEZI|nr:hypothetical protein AC578_9896 [Pseudocercospora eumusae]